ncbi:IS256 family transposase [Mycoplasma seminis]|uniref:Mutator family transposase n=1 Tax=Mycoplasma seminis TaxID=512749 RepID=A0ABY9HAD8_9MOLU|nr:transposase [Mycoplasma seminis]WLP85569.1 transposase [Mycoplasma seminis]
MIFEKNKFLRKQFYKLGEEFRDMAFAFSLNADQIIETIEEQLNNEIETHIIEQRTIGINEYRNGYYEKTIYTLNGKLPIKIPRLRGNNFASKIINKYERCSKDFENLISLMLMSFLSYEQIIDTMYGFTGIKIGHSIITRISEKIKTKYEGMYDGPINDDVVALFIDASYHDVKRWYNPETGEILNTYPNRSEKNKFIQKSYKQALYTAITINENGYKELVGLEVMDQESSETWSKFLNSLYERGLKNPAVVISDDFSGINNVINSVFPNALIQKCNFHKMMNFMNHVPTKERKEVRNDIKKIYEAENRNEADKAFVFVRNKYKDKYPRLIRILEKSLEEMTTFFKLPASIRKYIYTNNISEGFNSSFRKYVKEKCSHANIRTFKIFAIVASQRICRTWKTRQIKF